MGFLSGLANILSGGIGAGHALAEQVGYASNLKQLGFSGKELQDAMDAFRRTQTREAWQAFAWTAPLVAGGALVGTAAIPAATAGKVVSAGTAIYGATKGDASGIVNLVGDIAGLDTLPELPPLPAGPANAPRGPAGQSQPVVWQQPLQTARAPEIPMPLLVAGVIGLALVASRRL